ncbi:TatD DNase family protein [Gammaproteobacteria bacterium]
MLIDTHCHLDVTEFDPDRLAVLDRARIAGVIAQVIPGIHRAGWAGLTALCAAHADLYPALGLHPLYLDQHRPSDLQALEQCLAVARPLVIGEIGLDHFQATPDWEGQRTYFEAQLGMARTAGLPVLLHVRRAHDEVLAILARLRVAGGIAHAFNGSLEQARRYRDLGFCLGFGGMVTFERSTRLRRLAQALPLDTLVLETDAPDLTVSSHHGERNSPEYLPAVLESLAALRGEDPHTLALATTANARRVFQLDRTSQ